MLTVGPGQSTCTRAIGPASGIPIQGGGLKEGTLKIDSLQFSSLSGSPEIVVPLPFLQKSRSFWLDQGFKHQSRITGSECTRFFHVRCHTMSASARTPQWLLMPQSFRGEEGRGGRIEVWREGALAVGGWYEGGAMGGVRGADGGV
jgi:hypothetical protein